MTKRLLFAFPLLAVSLYAQYAPSASYSSTAAAEINGKPNYQLSGVSGCAAVNGTIGKDICTDSAGKVYVPSVTGTPATWVQIPTLPLLSAQIPNNAANTSGNAATATALAATPTLCTTTGQVPTGVLANGNATGCFTPTGSGVSLIANGAATLGTSSIASGACASVVTVTASGVATTDDIIADFNADPTSTTGYIPSSSGMLAIIKYPTSSNVNFKVCNNTASPVTPGAVTLNWRVTR
jgi:hypothetical protein